MLVKEAFLAIACKGELIFTEDLRTTLTPDAWISLQNMETEGFLQLHESGLIVTALGKAFIRNICMVFDRHHMQATVGQQVFSKAILSFKEKAVYVFG